MQLIDEENKCFPKEIEMSKVLRLMNFAKVTHKLLQTIDNKFLYLLLLSGSKELDFSELVNSDLYIGFKKWVDQNIDNDFLIIEILKIMSCIPLTITQLKSHSFGFIKLLSNFRKHSNSIKNIKNNRRNCRTINKDIWCLERSKKW